LDVANMLWACARFDMRGDVLVGTLVDQATMRVSEFPPQELANVVWALATLECLSQPMAGKSAMRLAADDLKTQDVANSL